MGSTATGRMQLQVAREAQEPFPAWRIPLVLDLESLQSECCVTVFSAAKRCLVVWAIILGMGAHWAVLQSVAWTGMVISYSQHTSFREALKNTFDGKHPCQMCKAVKEGRQSEQNLPQQKLLLKLDFFVPGAGASRLFPPALGAEQERAQPSAGRVTESPPTPPPILA